MDSADLARHYPRLYHMAEAGSWDSIELHGLLSTGALLDLFEVDDAKRATILRQRRPVSVPLAHDMHGAAVVRDQIPLREGPLRSCLTDMSLEEWLELLNSRVFFWLDEPHLETLLGAGAYRERAHDVIHVDTAALVGRHVEEIRLSPINSGATLYNPRPRGSGTFMTVAHYPFEDRRKARGVANAIVELAVEGGVRDIRDVATRVERRRVGGAVDYVIWEPAP